MNSRRILFQALVAGLCSFGLLGAAQAQQTMAVPQERPAQELPNQGAPIQGAPIQGVPIQGVPVQGVPIQGSPIQGIPIQGAPIQGFPIQGSPIQGMPIQGVPSQGQPLVNPGMVPPRATSSNPYYFGMDLQLVRAYDGTTMRVFRIKPNGPAQRAGLEVGDEIRSANGFGFSSATDSYHGVRLLNQFAATRNPGGTITPQPVQLFVRNVRDGRNVSITVYPQLAQTGPAPAPAAASPAITRFPTQANPVNNVGRPIQEAVPVAPATVPPANSIVPANRK